MENKQAKKNNDFISTEDWLPLVDIKNGMMEVKGTPLTGHQYVTGVRIEPKNIFIADSQVQNNTLTGLRDFYNTLDYEFWLICCDRPVDINLYRSELEIMYAQEENPNIRKMINEDIQKCDQFVGPQINAVDTEFYILFKDSVKNTDVIMKRIHSLISNLASAGLNSRQTTDEDLRVILDSFFNDSLKIEYGSVMTNV
ncbi:MAG: hypothetical protein K6C11_01510 [Bacilli bacterium]|nr:hypothetical protein [Bacilli bacterium]